MTPMMLGLDIGLRGRETVERLSEGVNGSTVGRWITRGDAAPQVPLGASVTGVEIEYHGCTYLLCGKEGQQFVDVVVGASTRTFETLTMQLPQQPPRRRSTKLVLGTDETVRSYCETTCLPMVEAECEERETGIDTAYERGERRKRRGDTNPRRSYHL